MAENRPRKGEGRENSGKCGVMSLPESDCGISLWNEPISLAWRSASGRWPFLGQLQSGGLSESALSNYLRSLW